QDAILINVKPEGPTCHTLNNSCFENEKGINFKSNFSLEKLERIINNRKKDNTKNSYTNKLFEEGIKKIGKKIGEEASEVIIASLAEKKEDLIYESADLIYHLLVLLANEEIKFEKVIKELEKRNNESN
ncbi:MAG: phosphoribosyl-ATP diphosphatase, partial [Dehalococcoidales bacterium]|nr:phosphoribosyl-ATP diphosphatase [Dehalococcoidales bacterium]